MVDLHRGLRLCDRVAGRGPPQTHISVRVNVKGFITVN